MKMINRENKEALKRGDSANDEELNQSLVKLPSFSAAKDDLMKKAVLKLMEISLQPTDSISDDDEPTISIDQATQRVESDVFPSCTQQEEKKDEGDNSENESPKGIRKLMEDWRQRKEENETKCGKCSRSNRRHMRKLSNTLIADGKMC